MSDNLREAPLGDLLTEIALRVVERDRDATVVAGGMIALIGKMTEGLSAKNKFRLSEQLRDLADELERPSVAIGT